MWLKYHDSKKRTQFSALYDKRVLQMLFEMTLPGEHIKLLCVIGDMLKKTALGIMEGGIGCIVQLQLEENNQYSMSFWSWKELLKASKLRKSLFTPNFKYLASKMGA